MKSSARKVELASASDLFSTEQERQDAKLEKVQHIPLTELYPFPDHPFSVKDDDSMRETVESIRESGVLQPAIARPREGGGYELVSGHRRKRACELAGLTAMPVIVRDLDRDTAIIFMVDTNIQREHISPIEKAKALKMKMEALKRQAGRPRKEQENNLPQVAANFRSDDEAARGTGMSGDTVRRLAVLDGGKCILQLRGVRPFLSPKFDITQHPNYKYLADADKRNTFNIERFLSTKLKPKPSEFYDVYEVEVSGDEGEGE